MLELGFISSSRVKLAHFEYLARKFGIRVYGFRKLTYWGSYDEPIVEDRETILRESYASALKKWTESGLPEERLFFFEDTSVVIDALSRVKEVPGTAVKFWMRKTNFDQLNKSIGNSSRGASIRSDIVLHLPKTIRSYLRSPTPYFATNSKVFGKVADEPSRLTRAPALYPWLDPKSFSGWFVPDGADSVLSDLPIGSADQFDFRLAAFGSTFEFIKRLRIGGTRSAPSTSRAQQDSLFHIPRRKVVLLCGHSCAGKTTAAQAIARNGAALHLEASDFMRTAMIDRLGATSNIPVQEFAEEALRDQPWIVPEQVLAFLSNMPDTNFVISGLRSLAEVEIIRAGLAESAIEMFYVVAPEAERYRRSVARSRGTALTEEEYQLECARQNAMGLSAIADSRIFSQIENSASLDEWLEVSAGLVSLPFVHQSDKIPDWLIERGQLTSLQIRCINALGSMGDSASFYTSGEITKFINIVADGDMVTTNDNVSRFLNQATYPFFEPKDLASRGIGWRLTSTGRSMYLTLLCQGRR